MKKKFFVSIELGLITVIFMLSLMIACLCLILFLPTTTPLTEDIPLLTTLIIMLFVLPSIIIIISCFICFPVIEIDNTGITKRLFGIKLKSIKWEEINFVQTKGQFNQWEFLSKIDLKDKSLSRCRMMKDNIFFFRSAKKLDKIKQSTTEQFAKHFKL